MRDEFLLGYPDQDEPAYGVTENAHYTPRPLAPAYELPGFGPQAGGLDSDVKTEDYKTPDTEQQDGGTYHEIGPIEPIFVQVVNPPNNKVVRTTRLSNPYGMNFSIQGLQAMSVVVNPDLIRSIPKDLTRVKATFRIDISPGADTTNIVHQYALSHDPEFKSFIVISSVLTNNITADFDWPTLTTVEILGTNAIYIYPYSAGTVVGPIVNAFMLQVVQEFEQVVNDNDAT